MGSGGSAVGALVAVPAIAADTGISAFAADSAGTIVAGRSCTGADPTCTAGAAATGRPAVTAVAPVAAGG
jgi:hypothetical protein